MNRILSFLFLSVFISIGFVQTGTAEDRNVKNALIDISKYEKQFLNKTSASKPTVKRSLNLLKVTRQRLDSAADHSAPSWIEADQRYGTLVNHMNGLLSGKAGTASAPASSAAAPAATATTTTKKPASKQMISHQRVQVKKLTRDIKSATDTTDKTGPKPFQDDIYVAKLGKTLNHYRQSLGRFSEFATDPDVVTAAAALSDFENMVSLGKDHGAKERAALGNVQERLALIEKQARQIAIPPTPQHPYKKGDLGQWIAGLVQARNGAIQTYKPIPEIRKRAYLPHTRQTVQSGGAYDLQDVDRLDRSLRDIVGKIDKGVPEFTANLDANMKHLVEGLGFYQKLDPNDRSDQVNSFLGAGKAEGIRFDLAQKAVLAGEAAEYAKLLKHKNYDDRIAAVSQVKAVSELYEANYQKARILVRMPKAATTDSDMTDIAEATLGNPKYDYVGDIKRMVINTEKTRRSKKTTQATIDNIDVSSSGKITATGTETTYFYEWDQFQVATVEPEGDKFYIFYSMLKNFSSGGPTTPLNKWIISSRHQSSEIPAENIDLD